MTARIQSELIRVIDQEQSQRMVIISGPSGAGKSTVVKRLITTCDLSLSLSVSATTRDQREGETPGVDYHFLSHEEFQSQREAGEFLECMEVFGRGDWYGTLEGSVAEMLAAGDWVVLEIDVEGALQLIDKFPKAVTIFIHPGSVEELERRLRNRGTETEDAIARRLEVGQRELENSFRYQHIVINHDADESASAICEILKECEGRDTCTTS